MLRLVRYVHLLFVFTGLVNYIAKVLALLARKAKQAKGQAGGQTVDVSIFERQVHRPTSRSTLF